MPSPLKREELNPADRDLIEDVRTSRRRARGILDAIHSDPKVWAYLERHAPSLAQDIELTLESEEMAVEVEWLFEDKPEDYGEVVPEEWGR